MYEPKKLYQPSDLLQVQRSEEKANNVIMMLEANTEVLQSLEAFYKRLDKNEDFSTVEEVKFDLASFQARLHDMISDSKLQITRARLLVQITSNRKALVTYPPYCSKRQEADCHAGPTTSSYPGNGQNGEAVSQHVQFHNYGSTRYDCHVCDCFHHLDLSTGNLRVCKLGVRVVFGPETNGIKTFFSTDVIKYQGQAEGSGGVFSNTAMARWIQVALPLTALTGLFMGTGIWIADRKRRKEMQKLKDEDITTSV